MPGESRDQRLWYCWCPVSVCLGDQGKQIFTTAASSAVESEGYQRCQMMSPRNMLPRGHTLQGPFPHSGARDVLVTDGTGGGTSLAVRGGSEGALQPPLHLPLELGEKFSYTKTATSERPRVDALPPIPAKPSRPAPLGVPEWEWHPQEPP